MNILVTGGCGFIGSNFVNYAVSKYSKYNFVNIDTLYYCASLENINQKTKLSPNYKFIKGNINDANLIRDILVKENITHIVHFAAQTHVDNSFEFSLACTEDNVKGTHTLLESIRKINLKIVLIYMSTDEVYGESLNSDVKSEQYSILNPTNPYAASKAACEMYVNAYKYSFGLKSIIVRCNNVYGPNQYPEKLIPKFIKLLTENRKCTIHGDGNYKRSFVHVCDVCTAFDLIIHKGEINEIYNIGSENSEEKTVLEMHKMLVKKFKPNDIPKNWLTFVKDRPYNDKRYKISSKKMRLLGWKPTHTIENYISNFSF